MPVGQCLWRLALAALFAVPPCALAGGVDVARARDMAAARASIQVEAARYGGWAGWYEQLAPWHARWARHLETAEDLGKGVIAGADGFLFLRTWETYVLEPDYIYDADGSGPGTALATLIDLDRQLGARGIHLLVAPVPARSEIYPKKLLPGAPPPAPAAPQRLQFIEALLENNVEAIDLLPALLAGKGAADVSLKNDTHWTSYGASLAARAIADRLARYDWERLYGRPPAELTATEIDYDRSWSIYDRLDPEHRDRYPAGPVPVSQVRHSDGRPYAPEPDAPLLVTGDSFLFFYAGVQADVAAHLARNLGYPVATLPTGGGQAARVARSFARLPAEQLARHRVVVFIFAAPYLRFENWETAPLSAHPIPAGQPPGD